MGKSAGFAALLLALMLLVSCAAPEEAEKNVSPTGTAASTAPAETAAYDVDLLNYSSSMIYAEVFNMMNEPDDYVDKRVRMEGICATYQTPDRVVYGCIIADATACCKQGMEFVLSDDYAPEDYPAPGSDIVVSGVFELYQAGEFTFCHLTDCTLEAETPAG